MTTAETAPATSLEFPDGSVHKKLGALEQRVNAQRKAGLTARQCFGVLVGLPHRERVIIYTWIGVPFGTVSPYVALRMEQLFAHMSSQSPLSAPELAKEVIRKRTGKGLIIPKRLLPGNR